MKILTKIDIARQKIKSSDLKKAGHNTFSNYDYYTPEQVNKLVNDACRELRLFNKYQLKRSEYGLIAVIEVIDLESGEVQMFEMATDIPAITATNIAQQLGGAVTYSQRYLLMSIYDIVDNNLDFDAHKQKTDNIEWMSDKTMNKIIELAKTDKKRANESLSYWERDNRKTSNERKTKILNAINNG